MKTVIIEVNNHWWVDSVARTVVDTLYDEDSRLVQNIYNPFVYLHSKERKRKKKNFYFFQGDFFFYNNPELKFISFFCTWNDLHNHGI